MASKESKEKKRACMTPSVTETQTSKKLKATSTIPISPIREERTTSLSQAASGQQVSPAKAPRQRTSVAKSVRDDILEAAEAFSPIPDKDKTYWSTLLDHGQVRASATRSSASTKAHAEAWLCQARAMIRAVITTRGNGENQARAKYCDNQFLHQSLAWAFLKAYSAFKMSQLDLQTSGWTNGKFVKAGEGGIGQYYAPLAPGPDSKMVGKKTFEKITFGKDCVINRLVGTIKSLISSSQSDTDGLESSIFGETFVSEPTLDLLCGFSEAQMLLALKQKQSEPEVKYAPEIYGFHMKAGSFSAKFELYMEHIPGTPIGPPKGIVKLANPPDSEVTVYKLFWDKANPRLNVLISDSDEYFPIVRWLWVLSATMELRKLHQAGFVHLDIKCENILVSKDHKARLIDFGGAFAINANERTAGAGQCGTREYMCDDHKLWMAQQSKTSPPKQGWDFWSLAMVLAMLLIIGKPVKAVKEFLRVDNAHPEAVEVLEHLLGASGIENPGDFNLSSFSEKVERALTKELQDWLPSVETRRKRPEKLRALFSATMPLDSEQVQTCHWDELATVTNEKIAEMLVARKVAPHPTREVRGADTSLALAANKVFQSFSNFS